MLAPYILIETLSNLRDNKQLAVITQENEFAHRQESAGNGGLPFLSEEGSTSCSDKVAKVLCGDM